VTDACIRMNKLSLYSFVFCT